MTELLSWSIVPRRAEPPDSPALPATFHTLAPPFRHEGLPDEVGLLLPNQDGTRQLVQAVNETPDRFGGVGLGLFLADPFLTVARVCAPLRAAGVTWIANLPSVEQQDPEFARQLTDVALDHGRELAQLAAFKAEGFPIAAVVADAAGAEAAAAIAPDAVIVLPRVADFAAGFPSARQRGSALQAVAAALGSDWSGRLLGLGDAGEAAYPQQWPDAQDAMLCRPRPKG